MKFVRGRWPSGAKLSDLRKSIEWDLQVTAALKRGSEDVSREAWLFSRPIQSPPFVFYEGPMTPQHESAPTRASGGCAVF
jgi:hypothetical protein